MNRHFTLQWDEHGLILSCNNNSTSNSILIRYNNQIESLSLLHRPSLNDKIKLVAIVGILKATESNYLIGVVKSKEVAQLDGSSVMEVTQLCSIALDKERAKEQIKLFHLNSSEQEEEATEDEFDVEADSMLPEIPPDSLQATLRAVRKKRFIWQPSPFFPSKATKPEVTVPSTKTFLPFLSPVKTAGFAVAPKLEEPKIERIIPSSTSKQILDAKIVKELLFELKGMYYSNEVDITRSYQSKYESNEKRKNGVDSIGAEGIVADRSFFYNRHLSLPLLKKPDFVTVLMQGFVDSVSVDLDIDSTITNASIPEQNIGLEGKGESAKIEMILISRRSVERSGFRYQRRGIDETGCVANFVETEFIIKIFNQTSSFVQIRGSIPLFFTQSAFALKPAPILTRTPEASLEAARLHFNALIEKYHKQIILINLAESTGKEAAVVGGYKKAVESINRGEEIRYVGFDFHKECRGMNYSAVETMVTSLKLDSLSSYWFDSSQNVFSTQTGVVRTNCIDCLDRTSVVQSQIGKSFLLQFLTQVGIHLEEENEILNIAFRNLWADNGDRISLIYAGTAALKGDFTRTGKRNLKGGMNDAMNSLSRLVQNSVFDFFRQAVVDYTLGINLMAFEQFQKSLEIQDYASEETHRLVKIRAAAIETAVSTVLGKTDKLVESFTFSGPSEVNSVKAGEFIEKILLLTEDYIYVVQFDYHLEIVQNYSRIMLNDITGLQVGAYITGTNEDELENYGFLLHYVHRESHLVRTHSNTIDSRLLKPKKITSSSTSTDALSKQLNPLQIDAPSHFVAFKALKHLDIKMDDEKVEVQKEFKSAKETIQEVVEIIKLQCTGAQSNFIYDKSIISVAEAIPIADRLLFGIKQFIWY